MYSKYPKHEVHPVLLSAAAASPAQKSPQDQGYAEKAPAAVPAVSCPFSWQKPVRSPS